MDGTSYSGPLAELSELRRSLAAAELRARVAERELQHSRQREALRAREAALLAEALRTARTFAHHDELTGLANRYLLRDRFDLVAALAARHDQQAALLFIDLDRFKAVNDTLGHAAGDELLRQVAQRLVACIRSSDTACRYGGDEFVVLLAGLAGKDGAATVAAEIGARVAAPYDVAGTEIAITMSLGIAVHGVDAVGYEELLRAADFAMFRDKARRPGVPQIASAPLVRLAGGARA